MKFRNGPTSDKAKFRIFGVINVCRSMVEKGRGKGRGMPEDREVAAKKRDAIREGSRTNEETDSEEKSISSFFQSPFPAGSLPSLGRVLPPLNLPRTSLGL